MTSTRFINLILLLLSLSILNTITNNVYSEETNESLGEIPISILALTISTIGLAFSIYTYKRSEGIPLIKDHFTDLKTSVIDPLVKISRNSVKKFPHLTEIYKGEITIYSTDTIHSDDPQKDAALDSSQVYIDRILMEDLINNHYPRVKTAWEETWNFYNEKVINHQDLRDYFYKIFEEIFKQNNLDLNEFKIWRIIEYFLLKKEYKENNLSIFTYHSFSHVINLGEWSHKKIYESENLDTGNSVKYILDQIFKKFIQLEDVKEKLKIYELKCNNYDRKIEELDSLLTKLKYKKKLHFEKDDSYTNLCKIIDSRI